MPIQVLVHPRASSPLQRSTLDVQCSMFVFHPYFACYFPCFVRRITRGIQRPPASISSSPHTSFVIRKFGIRHSSPTHRQAPRSTANLAINSRPSPEISPASQVDQAEHPKVPGVKGAVETPRFEDRPDGALFRCYRLQQKESYMNDTFANCGRLTAKLPALFDDIQR